MTPQELKNSILQLAIQGKLVGQRQEEGTAEELYTQIQAEKQKLIEAGKIKKEKPLPEIAEDEKPFDIPDSWKWVRLGETIRLTSGQDLENKYYNSAQNGIPYITGASNIKDGVVLINRWTEYPKSKAYKGNLLITCKGTIGAMAFLQEPIAHIARQIMSIATYSNNVCLNFVKIVLETYVANLRQNARSMIPGISRDMILCMPIPLPPLAEQKRIVAKIEELLPLIDRYEKAWTKLEDLNKRFPDDLKKSLLQLAIQGKLVEQRQEEGTGDTVFAELKQHHIGQKACGDGLNLSSMNFEIPTNWLMVELNQLFNFIDYRGKTPNKINNGVFLITASNIRQGYMDYMRKEYISQEEYETRKSRGITYRGDLLFTTEAPVGNVALCDLDVCSCGQRIITFQEYEKETVFPKLYMYFILSPQFQQQLLDNCTGTTAKGIKADKLKHLLLPLPPYLEQKRIVEKLEELLKLTNKLEL